MQRAIRKKVRQRADAVNAKHHASRLAKLHAASQTSHVKTNNRLKLLERFSRKLWGFEKNFRPKRKEDLQENFGDPLFYRFRFSHIAILLFFMATAFLGIRTAHTLIPAFLFLVNIPYRQKKDHCNSQYCNYSLNIHSVTP